MCTKQCLINSIHALRNEAWIDAMKYRFDPAMGPAHMKILQKLNEIIDHQEKVEAIHE